MVFTPLRNAEQVRAKHITELQDAIAGFKIVNVKDHGAKGDGVTDDTAAIALAVAALPATGGHLYFPKGTYLANVNLSGKGTTGSYVVSGSGAKNTIIKATSGIVLDLASTSRVTVRDIGVNADGADIGILAARYTTNSGAGAFQRFERVEVTGTPVVAGLYHIGAEVSEYTQCYFTATGSAPAVIVSAYNRYGAADATYASAHGTLVSPASQFTTKFRGCEFIKTITNSGPCVEIGALVYDLSFDHCYTNAGADSACVEFNFHGISSTCCLINFKEVGFEANGQSDGHGAHGIRSYGNTVGSVYQLVVEDCFFRQERKVAGFYDIDFATVPFSMAQSRIRNNKTAFGGGLNLGNVYTSTIHWLGTSIPLAAAITATDTTFTVAAGHAIQIGDWVAVGYSLRYDGAAASTRTEVRQVTNVVGDVITVAAFTYNHLISELVLYSIPLLTGGLNNTWDCFAKPITSGLDLANVMIVNGQDVDYRIYIGQGDDSSRQAPVVVHRPFGDEPNAGENGMIVYCKGAGWWTTTTNLDGWAQTNFPGAYSGRWYALPLAMTGSASWNPSSIANGAEEVTTVTVTGAALGDFAVASMSIDILNLTLTAYVSAADTVTVSLANSTGGAIDLGAATVRVIVMKH